MSRFIPIILPIIFSTFTSQARAQETTADIEERRGQVIVMSGGARAISHGLSASRDTAGFTIMVTPYSVINAGGDLSILTVRFPKLTLRMALFGMIELQSANAFEFSEDGFIGLFPVADVGLWRGLNGGSIGVSFDDWARRRLSSSPRAAFEVLLVFRHESEHFTGPGDYRDDWLGIPHIGDFFMPEVATRLPVGPVEFEFRLQIKAFIHPRYIIGPGLDAIVRWRAHPVVHPFLSCFFEYIVGGDNEGVPIDDIYLFRTLLGVSFPGRVGDVQLFVSIAQGHGKGLNAFNESFRFGGGFRVVMPSTTRDWRSE